MKRMVRCFAVLAGAGLLALGFFGCSAPAEPSAEPTAQTTAAAAAAVSPRGPATGTEPVASDEPKPPALDHMRALVGFGGTYTVDKSPVVGCRPGTEADFRAMAQTAGLADRLRLQAVRYSLAELKSFERRASAILGKTADCRVNPEQNAVEVFISPAADAKRPAGDAECRAEVWRRLEADAALGGVPDAFLIVGPATADGLIEWSSDVNADGVRFMLPNEAPDAGGCLRLRLENTGGQSIYVRLDGDDFHLADDAVIEIRPGEFVVVQRVPAERLAADGGVCFEVGYGLERAATDQYRIVWQMKG